MKLYYVEREPQRNEKDDIIDRRIIIKRIIREKRERLLGDYMLDKQPRKNKWSTPYEPAFYAVCSIPISQITARRVKGAG